MGKPPRYCPQDIRYDFSIKTFIKTTVQYPSLSTVGVGYRPKLPVTFLKYVRS